VPDETRSLRRRLLPLLPLALLLAVPASPVIAAHKSFAGAPSPVTDASDPRVLTITSQRRDSPDRAGLNDRITLTVRQLPSLLEDVDGNCASLVLFLGGMPLKGLAPESCDPQEGQVRFLLVRTDAADEVWHALLGSPGNFYLPVTVSLGTSESLSIPSNIGQFPLVILPRFELYFFFASLAVGIVLYFMLARRSELLRSPAGLPGPDGRRPYSLSRFQLGFWFFVVVAAYLFLWLVTGELNTITESILALIGIGSGTALGASLIDTGQPPRPAGTVQRRGSGGFLHDVLSDGAGVSLHRLQMFVWTIVLGIIFCSSVYRRLAMPEFSATLLGLMGISSGTYLGFKFPERDEPKPPMPPISPTPPADGGALPPPPVAT
jgi:hypothetical protein